MTRQWGSPDLPPEPDAATLRELARAEAAGSLRGGDPDAILDAATRRALARLETVVPLRGRLPAKPRSLDQARDVPLVTDTGRRLINSQPVRPLGLNWQRRTPAVALVPVTAALCAVIALAAIGAAHVATFAAHHWVGALELVALVWAAFLLITSLVVKGIERCRRGR